MDDQSLCRKVQTHSLEGFWLLTARSDCPSTTRTRLLGSIVGSLTNDYTTSIHAFTIIRVHLYVHELTQTHKHARNYHSITSDKWYVQKTQCAASRTVNQSSFQFHFLPRELWAPETFSVPEAPKSWMWSHEWGCSPPDRWQRWIDIRKFPKISWLSSFPMFLNQEGNKISGQRHHQGKQESNPKKQLSPPCRSKSIFSYSNCWNWIEVSILCITASFMTKPKPSPGFLCNNSLDILLVQSKSTWQGFDAL